MKIKNRHKLRKKEAKEFIEKIEKKLGCKIEGEIEIADYKGIKLIFINYKLHGLIYKNEPFLNVEGIRKYGANKKYVVVDNGAVKHILNGADIMVPGIIYVDKGIKKGDLVWIRDERGLPVAIGEAIMDGEQMLKAKKGKAIINIHYIGDEIWKLSKK